MSSKVSVVVTNYSESSYDFTEVSKELSKIDTDLEVVYVYDTYGKGNSLKYTGTNIRHVVTGGSIGLYNSMRFGLLQTTGDYVYFLSSDSEIKDPSFIRKACELYNNGADIVFGRSEIISEHGQYIMEHPFENHYSAEEFLKEWHNLRMIFVDYFAFSSILFRKDMLIKAEAFISGFPDAISQDTATLLKCVLLSGRISFCESVGCARLGPVSSKEITDKSDMTAQVVNHFSIPLDIYDFMQKHQISDDLKYQLKTFFNQYALYAFNAIVSDYFQISNKWIFQALEPEKKLKGKKIYLYGHGWVGMELNKFLREKGLKVESFIDDFKRGEDIISLKQFRDEAHSGTAVIIASYKCSDVFRIYKKLNAIDGIEMIDLIQY